MTLHKRTLLSISFTMLFLILMVYAVARMVVLQSFILLEEDYARKNLQRALNTLHDQIDALNTFVVDWAMWDDTYKFIEDANEEYIRSNLLDTTFIDTRLHLMLFLHTSGRLVFGKAVDWEEKQEVPLPDSLREHLGSGARLLAHSDPDSSIAGILLLPEGTMLLASRPIVTSAKEGPIRGTLIMGRYLNASEIRRLEDITHLTISFFRADTSQFPQDVKNIRQLLSPIHPMTIRALHEEMIAGYALLSDVYENPAMIVKAEMPRDIYKQGKISVIYVVSSLIAVCLVLGGIILLLLEKLVLSRLDRLNDSVSHIDPRKDLSSRVSVHGKDELASLAHAINDMLTALEESQGEVVESEERFRRLSEATFEGIVIHDPDRILDVNAAMSMMFGYQGTKLIGNPFLDLIVTESRAMVSEHIRSGYETGYEARGERQDGSSFCIEIQSKIMPYKGRNVIGSAIRDITWRKMAEESLRQRTREMTLLSHLSDLFQACRTEEETYGVVASVCKLLFPFDSGCLCMVNAVKTTLEVVSYWGTFSPKTRLFRIDNCQVIQKKRSLVCDFSIEKGCCSLWDVAHGRGCMCIPINNQGEILGILSLYLDKISSGPEDEEEKRALESKQMVANRVSTHYGLSLSNLRLRETLKQESIHDSLTGLYNRRYMEESLERESRRAERRNTSVGIILLDVDHFKRFNDTYGHDAGDLVLSNLGAFLKENIRSEDIACRYGGEEFLLILPDAPVEAVRQRAEDLRAGIKDLEIFYQEQSLRITSSCGVAALPIHGPGVKNAVNAADEALYQAKAAGRDRVMVAKT